MATTAKKDQGARRKGKVGKPTRKPRPATGRGSAARDADRSAPQLAEVDAEVLEFIEAIDRFKKQHGRPFPSWSEVLMVLRDLGYRRG